MLISLIALVGTACAEPEPGSGEGGSLPPPADDPDPLVVPTEGEALLEWLVAEPYLEWPGESGVHASTGPHFGGVQTFITPALASSLEAGDAQHPAGSATVKELYGDGDFRRGWSVSVKLADDSDAGNQWYWYEWYDGSAIAEGNGISVCTGCHSGGQDFVLTPFPLQ